MFSLDIAPELTAPAPASAAEAAQPAESAVPGDGFNRITRLIARCDKILWLYIALLYLICFNGQWRIGLDSANYRGLADSIAGGRGYTFGEWAPHNVYPGFPLLLAALQKAFGSGALAPCMSMLVMSAMTMVVTYRLIRLHYPKWIAVTVTFGLATNSWYLQQSSELMTDVPFLLGVVTGLYGWDLLQRREGPRARAIAILCIGLIIAATTRPTFLILVAAWGLACTWGLVRERGARKRFYAIALGVMFSVWIAFVALDPRSRGFHPLSGGGYEREAVEILSAGAPTSRLEQVLYVLNDQLPSGFFGEQLSLFSVKAGGRKYSPTSIFGSLVLLASIGLIVRRHFAWALLAWLTFVATVIYSAEPRYYLMVMPILLLAWLRLLVEIARRLPSRWGEVAVGVGLALVVANNVSRSIAFIKEQRSAPFLDHYKSGKWLPAYRMAMLIRQRVPGGESVLGPSGSVVSYLSGRHVWSQREIVPRRGHVSEFPRLLYDKHIAYAVFPATLYKDKEPAIRRMMERGIMRAGKHRIAETGDWRLHRLYVHVPPADWTKLPKLPGMQYEKRPATRPVKKRPPSTRPVRPPSTRRAAPKSSQPGTTTRTSLSTPASAGSPRTKRSASPALCCIWHRADRPGTSRCLPRSRRSGWPREDWPCGFPRVL
jgi:hypothetical protein